MKRVGDGELHVALSRSELKQLPLLSHPEAPVGDDHVQGAVATFENAAAKWPQQY